MKIIQVSGQSPKSFIFSIDMEAEDVPVKEVKILRHAGDMDDGDDDSWFIECLVSVKEWNKSDPKVGYIRVAQKFTTNHGISKVRVERLANQIKAKGTLNLVHWWYSN